MIHNEILAGRLYKMVAIASMLLLCKIPAYCQIDEAADRRIDSLKAALVGSLGQTRFDILDKLVDEHALTDPMALPYAKEAFALSWRFGDSARIVRSGRLNAMFYDGLEKYDSSITLSQMLLPIARRNNYVGEIERLLNLIAVAHSYKAEYDKALAYHLESLELRKKHEGDFLVSISLNNLGVVHYKMKNYRRALGYFLESLRLCSSEHAGQVPNVDNNYYSSGLAYINANISLCYSFLNDVKNAEQYVKKAHGTCEGGCSNGSMISVLYAYGVVYLKSGDLEMASAKFLKSLSLARESLNRRFVLDNLIYLSEIAITKNELGQAEEYLMEAEPLFGDSVPFSSELIKVYHQLFQLHSRLGNYRKVAYFQNKYIQLKDSVFNEELATNLMKVDAEYQERENKTKIEAQGKILELSNNVINRQRALNVVVGIVAVLAIALVFVLNQNIKQKKRANSLLEQRIKERTIELEENHNLLLRSIRERDIQTERMSNEIRSSLATIKGLGRLVLNDLNMTNTSMYVGKIEETSNNLLDGLDFNRPRSWPK